ncbi:uncharacterized protein LOC123534946 [Mercenaria mercenaria]|uniref:uncharacterized protein LOC123534946 n=1 Tax=Mercenaria mercenaria TaxID=6596 RepID=UPI00234E6C47|nr:uncharacterized protein LOC123534946 [Mercenaria mercenaria]
MRINYIICVVIIYGYAVGFGLAETKAVRTTTLHTDLVDIIGKNNSCAGHMHENISTDDKLFAKQGIVISNYKFHDVNLPDAVISKCDVINIQSQHFAKYSWTCFATDNSTSRDPNWFFVDCRSFKILSVKCLNIKEVPTVTDNLCRGKVIKERNNTCHEFSYGKGRYAVCSQNFSLKKIVRTKSVKQASYTDIEDILAYLSAAFILVTFLLAVAIPSEKCKPTYNYDKEQALRVPLEIYEMYGVSYQPSAKKKRNLKSLNMDVIPAVSSHMSNVAAVANNPVNWKGYKTKFNFEYNQPLFQAMTRGFGDNIKGNSNCEEKINKEILGNNDFDDKRKRVSINSIESVGTFDYTLFHNDPDLRSNNMTSETFSDEEQKAAGEEGVQEYRNGHNDKLSQEERKLDKDNEDFIAELTSAKRNVSTHFISSDYDEKHGSSYQNGLISSIDENNETDTNKECNNENAFIENCKDGVKDKNGKGDDEFDNVYAEKYEKENILSPIYEDSRETSSCTCDNRSDFVCSDTSSVSSSNNGDVMNVKTITEYQTIEMADAEGYTENGDVNSTTDALRPRISITVEFPKNFGIRTGTKIEHIADTTEEGECKYNIKRSLSATKAPVSGNSSQMSRKFSLC